MSGNLAFWIYAYILMVAALISGFKGVAHIKRGSLEKHRRSMVLACNLLIFFVVTYALKLVVLGREVKVGWVTWEFVILYIHESFIFLMLLSGTYARLLARRFKDLSLETISRDLSKYLQRHKVAAKIALASAVCALFTATFVLYIIYKHPPP